MTTKLERYVRQMIFPDVGREGQKRLLASAVTVIGCGALGSIIADTLTRAGIGHLRIVDRDYVELSNLQRQVLFDEEDIARGLPKAIAAAERLRRVNSGIEIVPVVADVNADNIESLIAGADLVMDGTDNFETRFLINDACVKHGTSWIYSGAVSTYGMTMSIVPGETACLRCLLGSRPAPGTLPTCDTAGVLNAVVGVIASLASAEAMKLLLRRGTRISGVLHVDVWANIFESFHVSRRAECPTCGQHRYEFLKAEEVSHAIALCGRNAVQVRARGSSQVALADLARRLEPLGEVSVNEFLLRFRVNGYELTIFPDARAIVKGTDDETLARGLYARYIGM